MAGLAEGVQSTIAYKFYASGTMDAETLDQSPGTSGAQYLRRVSSTLNLRKATYQSAEIRTDRQIVDYRHGGAHVEGDIAGELSPATWFDLIEACHRDTRAAGGSFTQADFTSVAANASTSTITLGSGDPVTSGLRVGDIINLTSTSVNANTNFMITGFSGTNNRDLAVYPAPVDMLADTTFGLARLGSSTEIPSSGFVSRKAAIEIAHTDIQFSRVFCECRLSKYAMSLPATGMTTMTASVMGRSMFTIDGSPGAYFASPTAETTTGIISAVNGVLMLDGTKVGVVTGLTVNMEMAADAPMVTGQNFPPEVFLGTANVTGQITAFLQDSTIIDAFNDETELSLLVYLTATSAADTPAMSILLPRIKLGDANVNLSGQSGQVITAPYQALKYVGATAGLPGTTIRIVDTEV